MALVPRPAERVSHREHPGERGLRQLASRRLALWIVAVVLTFVVWFAIVATLTARIKPIHHDGPVRQPQGGLVSAISERAFGVWGAV